MPKGRTMAADSWLARVFQTRYCVALATEAMIRAPAPDGSSEYQSSAASSAVM